MEVLKVFGDFIPPVLRTKRKRCEARGKQDRRRKRVVFADLILTTSPGRVFSWNRFARALLFIQVVCEPSEICRERAFCNTSLWILNTSGVSNHTGVHIRSPKKILVWHLQERGLFCLPEPNSSPSLFKFQSHVPSHDPGAITHSYPPLSSTGGSPPGMDASGWPQCLPEGRSPAATSTWPEFSPVEGHNSPKVAVQTIVYVTAHCCQGKGKRQRRNVLPALQTTLTDNANRHFAWNCLSKLKKESFQKKKFYTSKITDVQSFIDSQVKTCLFSRCASVKT